MRRLGAAAVDMCHVALGIVEAYWEYRLKPWDMAAGVLVLFCFFPKTSILILYLTMVNKDGKRVGSGWSDPTQER